MKDNVTTDKSLLKFGIFKHSDVLSGKKAAFLVSEIHKPLRRELYTILFSGPERAKHFVDNQEVDIPPYSVLFVGPDRLMHFSHQVQNETLVLFFNSLLYNRMPRDVHFLQNSELFHNSGSIYIFTPPGDAIGYCKTLSYLLYTNQEQLDSPLHRDLIHNIIQQILIMGTIYSQQTNLYNFLEDKDSLFVLNFRTLLDEQFIKEKTVQFYADKLNVTEKRLNKATKTILNLSAKEVIIRKIMEEAKWKLIYTPDSVKEISQDLGFFEENNFSAFFFKNEGLRPTQFRIKYKSDILQNGLAG